MQFNSITFVVFFIAVVVLHALPFSWKLKKFNLLLASYLFYAAWNPPFVVLIWISTVIDWIAANRIQRAQTTGVRRAFLVASLTANLGLLGFFKYGTFLLDQFVALAHAFGVEYAPAAPDIILPVGISFYTFQSLSYTIDVYRGNLRPAPSFLDFALYVTFFPQLVAGPIVRAAEFLPQLLEPRTATAKQFSWGLVLLVVGLFQKSLIADTMMAPISDAVFNASGPLHWHNAWAGAFAFSMQILFDFAGYSTCAIGVAMCLGFGLPDNFRYPYAAIGFSDLWRRWHISLSSWLRDYLYIPLGGNRKGALRVHVNLMITMLLGGLWHGASWTFVAWGGLHGLYLIAERMAERRGAMHWFHASVWRQLLGVALTFAAVCVTWVFFRAETFGRAFEMVGNMVGVHHAESHGVLGVVRVGIAFIMTACVIGYHFLMRGVALEDVAKRTPAWAQGVAIALMLVLLLWNSAGGESHAFIYFQF